MKDDRNKPFCMFLVFTSYPAGFFSFFQPIDKQATSDLYLDSFEAWQAFCHMVFPYGIVRHSGRYVAPIDALLCRK